MRYDELAKLSLENRRSAVSSPNSELYKDSSFDSQCNRNTTGLEFWSARQQRKLRIKACPSTHI
jgi:hypothetical protein